MSWFQERPIAEIAEEYTRLKRENQALRAEVERLETELVNERETLAKVFGMVGDQWPFHHGYGCTEGTAHANSASSPAAHLAWPS